MLPASSSSTSLQQNKVISHEHRNILPFSFFMAIISLNHSGRALGGNSFILGNRLFRLWRALPSQFQSIPQIIRQSNASDETTWDRAPRSQVSLRRLVRHFSCSSYMRPQLSRSYSILAALVVSQRTKPPLEMGSRKDIRRADIRKAKQVRRLGRERMEEDMSRRHAIHE